ncbi:MAG: restriction endonuclease [Pseudomonadota bacterium]
MSHADIRAVPRQVRELEKQERKARKAQQDGPNEEDEEPDEQDWREQLLDVMRSLEPDAFERLAQRLLRESGFTKVEVTGRSGDGGIDGTGVLRVNLLSFHVLFQCKRYSGTVGAGVVRDFRGAMVGRADKGLIITTGTFSPDAKREATRDGAPALDLVDGDTLCDLLKQLGIGVSVKQVEEVEIDKSAFVDI